ncbi:MAG: oligosaccharide flippase family protein [Candidatus Omnitrophica bacterium]|jgi:O-antigen/teichoic acid export membrane protein|nr:oligosaccharide flippase family protein [Candidatus Omnitrophota bacterium]
MKTKIKAFIKDEFILHAAIVFLGTSLVGAFNLLYHLISVRLLSPQDYGTFNALVSFVMFASMAISPLGTTLTRFFTEYIARGDLFKLALVIKKLFKRLFLVSFLIFIFFAVFSPQIAKFLNTQSLYVFICGWIILLSLFSPPITSIFQSFQKFLIYSAIGIIATFGKLLTGTILMYLGWSILGCLLGYLAGPIFMIFISLLLVSHLFRDIGLTCQESMPKISLVPIYKYFLPVSIAMLSFTFLTSIDIILVKHFFSDLDAGYYSIAQMVGKIALFLPSALAIVILPKSTNAHVTNGIPLRFLKKSLVLGGLFCGLFTFTAFVFPEFLLKILTGKFNSIIESLTGLFALAMSFYALSWIIINYLLATHNLKFVLPLLILTIFETIAVYIYHPSLKVILYIVLLFAVISLIFLLLMVKTKKDINAQI